MSRQILFVALGMVAVAAVAFALVFPYNLKVELKPQASVSAEVGLVEEYDQAYALYCQSRSREDISSFLEVGRSLAESYRQERNLEVEKRLGQILATFPDSTYLSAERYPSSAVANFEFIKVAFAERSQQREVEALSGLVSEWLRPC